LKTDLEIGARRPVVKDILEKYLVLGLPDVADARQRLAGLTGT